MSGANSSSEERKEEHGKEVTNTDTRSQENGNSSRPPYPPPAAAAQQDEKSSSAAVVAAPGEEEDETDDVDEKKIEQQQVYHTDNQQQQRAPEPPPDYSLLRHENRRETSEEEKVEDDEEALLARSIRQEDQDSSKQPLAGKISSSSDPDASASTKPILKTAESWIPGNESDNEDGETENLLPEKYNTTTIENNNNNNDDGEENYKKTWTSDAPQRAILRSSGPKRQTPGNNKQVLKKASVSWNPSEDTPTTNENGGGGGGGGGEAGDTFPTNVPLQRRMSDLTSRSNLKKTLSLNSRTGVQFSHVHIREYHVCIGDNPTCSYGAPISLDWNYEDNEEDIPIDVYENHYVLPRNAMKRRARRSLVLSYNERRARLWKAGYSLDEIDEAAKDCEREKWRQSMLGNLEALYRIEEIWVLHIKPCLLRKRRRHGHGTLDDSDDLNTLEQIVREEHSVSRASSAEFLSPEFDIDAEDEDDLDAESGNSVIIEGIESLSDKDGESSSKQPSSKGRRSGSSDDVENTYNIKVDKKQQDKATEIRLRSFARPHMRAFHASWFSFFVAFFSWFAISPLLSEIKKSLELSKTDIWTSSLCGTAGTVVMRILMGPLCDKFGSRICMAMILIVAAVPTAFTGLVQTSAGLNLVRLFIGIGGSSFVACQYWTSEMFSREVAGTANAMVAGWGNLGGGVTNVVMGSVLFPLFVLFFDDEEEDDEEDVGSGNELLEGITTREEKAWRTVFIVPALLALFTAFAILCYCDDSPKGNYRARIKNEQMTMVSPRESLEAAARNWNVWVLCVQYACCFGIEVTMTNATASYFTDEFGQSTVSAAAIASIFGFMNLWARGLGGLISDTFQNKFGIPGRLFWQILTLSLEGVGVILFGFAESFAWSIIALVFMSIMVQSAEGSTFGIVPYVDRRYTGSVVGIIGAGGNLGGVLFAVFFRQFSYKTAFILMGMSAVASALFSCFMQTTKLEQRYATADVEHEQVLEVEKKASQSEPQTERSGRGSVKSEPVSPNGGLPTNHASFHSEPRTFQADEHVKTHRAIHKEQQSSQTDAPIEQTHSSKAGGDSEAEELRNKADDDKQDGGTEEQEEMPQTGPSTQPEELKQETEIEGDQQRQQYEAASSPDLSGGGQPRQGEVATEGQEELVV